MGNVPNLSVVILCYRAGETARNFVYQVIRVLHAANIFDYELILVGNYHEGDDDPTPRVVADLSSENSKIFYVAQKKEGMMGWDMRSGLKIARGDYIAVIDGDGQMPIEDLVKVYKKIKDGHYDLVKTFRTKRGDDLWRKIVSFFYNVLFRILFPGLMTRDANAKPKILTRSAYEKLRLSSNDWFIDAEIMIQARRLGFMIGEIPTHFLGLTGRRSFIRFRTIFEFIKNLVKFRIKEYID